MLENKFFPVLVNTEESQPHFAVARRISSSTSGSAEKLTFKSHHSHREADENDRESVLITWPTKMRIDSNTPKSIASGGVCRTR